MNYELLKETARYYKEDPKGVLIMCRAFEEVRQEGIEQGLEQGIEMTRLNSIRNLMENLKISAQQAMDLIGVPNGEQAELAAKI